jgi:hypothetical protein
VDSHTEVAKENETPRKAPVVSERRQGKQDGTLKRRKAYERMLCD